MSVYFWERYDILNRKGTDMIYQGITISKEEASLLIELFRKILHDKVLFKWMHSVGLITLFDELSSAVNDNQIATHIEQYHD